MTLMRDKSGLLPVDKRRVRKIFLSPISNYAPAFDIAEHLAERLRAEGFDVTYKKNAELAEHLTLCEENDLIIYAMFSRSVRPAGFLDFLGGEASKLARSQRVGDGKSVFVSFGSPYFFKQYFPRARTYVNAYSMLSGAADAFVDALTGKCPFYKYSPVEID